MNSFRIQYKQLGYVRRRAALARRRSLPLFWLRAPVLDQLAGGYPLVVFVQLGAAGFVLQVGDYLVSEEGDPLLWGCPDIRY